jgi:hypothetical protein
MANSKKRCKQCREYHPAEDGIQTNAGWFCGDICLKANQSKPKPKAKPKRKPKSALQKRKDNVRSGYWKKKADALWGRVIHSRGCCAVSNGDCSGNLEAHHLITRANVMTRHCIDNGILLCSTHHKFSPWLSAHKAPLAFAEWLMQTMPDTAKWCSDNKYKTGKPDYREAYEHLLKWCELNGVSVDA